MCLRNLCVRDPCVVRGPCAHGARVPMEPVALKRMNLPLTWSQAPAELERCALAPSPPRRDLPFSSLWMGGCLKTHNENVFRSVP